MKSERLGGKRPRRSLSRMLATRHAHGTVKAWRDEEGWGVLISPHVSGEVFVHFSAVEGRDHARLVPGESVEFTYRRVRDQDGYSFVADSVRAL